MEAVPLGAARRPVRRLLRRCLHLNRVIHFGRFPLLTQVGQLRLVGSRSSRLGLLNLVRPLGMA